MSDRRGALPPNSRDLCIKKNGRRLFLLSALALAACGGDASGKKRRSRSGLYPNETPQLRSRINYWAAHYGVPAELVHRVVRRESGYRAEARNGPYYGLMQILPQTAQTMGYRGPPSGLLNADTNLQYAVKYLRGAYLVADRNQDKAITWYARGYYYEAKRKGLLKETGLRG